MNYDLGNLDGHTVLDALDSAIAQEKEKSFQEGKREAIVQTKHRFGLRHKLNKPSYNIDSKDLNNFLGSLTQEEEKK